LTKRAEQLIRTEIASHPGNKGLRYSLIDILLQQGKDELAMKEVEQAMAEFGVEDSILPAAAKMMEILGPLQVNTISGYDDKVSLCMIVKNEEKHLAKCLLSVKPLVDEMVVVDTGSTDRTKDIAKVFGAKVYDFEWTDDFSEARNFSISHSSGSWIFIMDADEVISPLDHEEFKNIVEKQTSKSVAYSLETRNYTLNANTVGWRANEGKYSKEEAGTGWYPSVKVRLFKSADHIRFQFPVHEMVDPSLKASDMEIERCGIPIHHYGQLEAKQNDNKAELYYSMGVKKLDKMGNDIAAIRELAVQAGNLGKWNESISLWKRVVGIKSDFAEAYINIGSAHWNLGEYENALVYAQRAVELAPHVKEAYFNMSISHLLLGNAKQAVSVLERLTQKCPDYMAARFMLGASYCCDRRKSEGLRSFGKLRQEPIGPALSFAIYDLAKRLVSAQRLQYAILLLAAAIESRNSNKEIVALFHKYQRNAEEKIT